MLILIPNVPTDQQVVDEERLETTYDLTEVEERESGIKIQQSSRGKSEEILHYRFQVKTSESSKYHERA